MAGKGDPIPHAMNSQPWWDEFFRGQWEANRGREQTRHFMQRLLDALPAPEAQYLSTARPEVLDWGCALGEGVRTMAERCPGARVTGLDFSQTAIEAAKLRYGDHEFIRTDGGAIPRSFDVIVTSNCLEHFERPLEVIAEHLHSCRMLYVALVPYDEHPLCEYHRSAFREESFPKRIGSFTRLAARVIDVDQTQWTGQQILVVYGSDAYVRQRAAGGVREQERQKWDDYYATAPLVEEDDDTRAFGVELAAAVTELLEPGARVLEAGCGAGWQAAALARTGRFDVTLLDFSPLALSHARQVFARENLAANFVEADAFTAGEPEYDLVLNAGVLEHYTFDEQVALLRGIASRSRRYVLALVPNRLCSWYWLWRVQRAARGGWPFGKEVPLADLSAVFGAAGLHFVGHAFMGAAWAEGFVRALSGMDEELVRLALDLHRSPVVPEAQKAYLVAGLGAVSNVGRAAGRRWTASPFGEDRQAAEVVAALSDAMALRVAGEVEITHLRGQIDSRKTVEVAERRAADLDAAQREDRDREQELRKRLAEQTAAADEAARRADELRRRLDGLQAESRGAEQRRDALRAALAREQHARQLLEGAVSATYVRVVDSVRQVVREHVPDESVVLVVSKGDEALLDLAGKTAWHFPRGPGGEYAGHYPPDSDAAVAQLESLRQQGAQFLVLPNAAFWWLEHYRGFHTHLDARYARAWGDERCILYDLRGVSDGRGNGTVRARGGGIWRRLARILPTRATHAGNGASRPSPPPRPQPPAAVLRRSCSPANTYDVVIFSVIEWDFRFARPQQLACRFADAGHRVFYVSQDFRPHGEPYTLREVRANVFEASLRGPRQNIYKQILTEAPTAALAEALDALRRDRAIESAVVMVHLPFWWPLAREARDWFGWPVVYDLMDDHAGFSNIMPHTLEQEAVLLESADLVVATSAMLEAQARRRSSNVVLVRNGCDHDHFSRAGTSPTIDTTNCRRPVIGYFGAIADWFDADLVADLAARRLDWDFVLVGSTHTGDLTRLVALPNVSLPGEKPYAEIPDWLARFDVAILPFKRQPLTEATNPVKAYEILAAGKPLVSVSLPEMRALGHLVCLADDAAGFEAQIVAALAEKDELSAERRRAFARDNTWQRRFEALDVAIKPLLQRRADPTEARAKSDESPVAALLAVARRAASGNGPSPRRLFLMFSGTTFTESEGQRPTRLARELARRGAVVAFVYWRWDRNPPRRSDTFPQVVQIPIDVFLEHHRAVLASRELAPFERVFMMEFPHPSLWRMVNLASAYGWRTVYDVIDDWEEFQKVGQADWYSPSVEHYLVDNADLTAVTCDALEDKVERMLDGRARVVRLPNAIEADAFAPPEAPAAVAKGETTVGYFGHLTDAWFDWDLLTALARRRPQWMFHVIGYGQPGGLVVPPNVLLLGKVEHRELPSYAANWDVAIIPFRPSPLSRAVDPIKVYEYVALGLPTVATGMPHLGTYPGVSTADGVDEVEACIERAAGRRPDPKAVWEFLARNDWGSRVDGLLSALAEDRNVSPVSVALGRGAAAPAMVNAG